MSGLASDYVAYRFHHDGHRILGTSISRYSISKTESGGLYCYGNVQSSTTKTLTLVTSCWPM